MAATGGSTHFLPAPSSAEQLGLHPLGRRRFDQLVSPKLLTLPVKMDPDLFRFIKSNIVDNEEVKLTLGEALVTGAPVLIRIDDLWVRAVGVGLHAFRLTCQTSGRLQTVLVHANVLNVPVVDVQWRLDCVRSNTPRRNQ